MFTLSEFWVESHKDLLVIVSRSSCCAALHPSVRTYSFMTFLVTFHLTAEGKTQVWVRGSVQYCGTDKPVSFLLGCWAASSCCDCEICGFQGYFGTGVGGKKASENVTKLTVPSNSLFFFLFWKKHSLGCFKNLVNVQSFWKSWFLQFCWCSRGFQRSRFSQVFIPSFLLIPLL